jgi:formylmethanofuran dehydrogenase subunit B
MDRAWIDGKAVTLKAAIAEAAKLLRASHCPVVTGLGTDIAGARAAIALAKRLGGVVDHMHSDALLNYLDVMREAGVMITTPSEARARADYFLLVGPEAASAFAELPRLLLGPTAPEAGGTSRRVGWLCPGRDAMSAFGDAIEVRAIGRNRGELAAMLAILRARVAGRPIGKSLVSRKLLDEFVADLTAARFGVAVWSPAALGPLETEMLQGIVADLNGKTRFSSLPLPPGDNALGVLQVCGWMAGFPIRTGFGRSLPEHDPWRFDARRLAEAGEVDCALWISAYGAAPPEWVDAVPVIALTTPDAPMRRPARVAIEIGQPGVDHNAVGYVTAVGALGSITVARPSSAASVAHVLSEIATTLPADT